MPTSQAVPLLICASKTREGAESYVLLFCRPTGSANIANLKQTDIIYRRGYQNGNLDRES